jgi:serine/threonine protein kinase
MEYLDGLNLAEFVEGYGPQPEGRVVNLLIQVCESLAEAHASGLIHRDIKPANIFVTDRGGVPDMVKVLDFGLVRPVVSADGAVLDAADAEIMAGTPSYMSPEAVENAANTDARSDLYSVGAVGYYLLTGQGRPADLPAPRSLDPALPGAGPEGPPAIRPRTDSAVGGQPSHCGLECRATGRLVGGPP